MADSAEPDAPHRRAHPAGRLAAGALLLVVVALVVGYLVGHDPTTSYRVPSGSMEPTLKFGAHVPVDLGAYDSGPPSIGDVVLLHPPVGVADNNTRCGVRISSRQACPVSIAKEDPSQNFFKRVVAGPGDTIFMRAGHLYRDGKREPDAYIKRCAGGDMCDFPAPVTIPDGHYFTLGDNRGSSVDSRFWGAVPRAWIVGQVVTCHALSTFCSAQR